MKTTFKFADGAEDIVIKTGEKFRVEKDINGFWGFRSDRGYNLWEGGNGFLANTKRQALSKLRELEKIEVLNSKFE